MILGKFRDGHPRSTLEIPATDGSLTVEFIVDTGFRGDLTLPAHLAMRLGVEPVGFERRALADGRIVECPCYEVDLELHEEGSHIYEILALQGMPLLGTSMMKNHALHVEMIEGGDVLVEPL